MISRFDKGLLSFFFKIAVVFFTCVTCVGNDIFIFSAYIFTKSFKKWYQCRCICRIRKQPYPYDIFTLHTYLYIVPRFELTVHHMIFFHSHEGCICVSFGITFSFTAYCKTFIVPFYSFQIFMKSVIISLYLCFSLSLAVYKFNVQKSCRICQE